MYPGEFERLFREISKLFTLETISKKYEVEGKFPKRNPGTPIWDALDSSFRCTYLDVGKEKYVSCTNFLKKPVRIMFFILITEFESRLLRIHEWKGTEMDLLNEKNMKDLIVDLLDSELINLQTEYDSKRKFKEDPKVMSLFRNIIMHVNKKLEKTVMLETIVKRKKQILKLLSALQQILDNMEHWSFKKNPGDKFNEKELSELIEFVKRKSLKQSVDAIYSLRKVILCGINATASN